MPIGDSKGAFYEDEFRQAASPWFIDPKMEGIDDNTKTPDQIETNKQLDKVEMNELGGIEIGMKFKKDIELEDRRLDTPEWDMNRLMDPKPITDSISGGNSTGAFDENLIGNDPWIPTELARKLGINDVNSLRLSDLYKHLGIKPINEGPTVLPK